MSALASILRRPNASSGSATSEIDSVTLLLPPVALDLRTPTFAVTGPALWLAVRAAARAEQSSSATSSVSPCASQFHGLSDPRARVKASAEPQTQKLAIFLVSLMEGLGTKNHLPWGTSCRMHRLPPRNFCRGGREVPSLRERETTDLSHGNHLLPVVADLPISPLEDNGGLERAPRNRHPGPRGTGVAYPDLSQHEEKGDEPTDRIRIGSRNSKAFNISRVASYICISASKATRLQILDCLHLQVGTIGASKHV